MNFDELLAGARPVSRTVRLCLRGDLIAAREQAERDLLVARVDDERQNRTPEAPAIAERILELEAEADNAAAEFHICAVGRTRWNGLLDENPATDKDIANDLDYGQGFPVAAIAACCVDPAMTVDQVNQLLEVISTRQYMDLWGSVLSVNMGADDLPKSVAATATLRDSVPKSTTAVLEESPGQSS
jgi:hypothetical protein